jgi:hypothetical protein
MGGFNLHHSRPDAADIKLDKQARNAATTTKRQLQDTAYVPETSFEKGTGRRIGPVAAPW